MSGSFSTSYDTPSDVRARFAHGWDPDTPAGPALRVRGYCSTTTTTTVTDSHCSDCDREASVTAPPPRRLVEVQAVHRGTPLDATGQSTSTTVTAPTGGRGPRTPAAAPSEPVATTPQDPRLQDGAAAGERSEWRRIAQQYTPTPGRGLGAATPGPEPVPPPPSEAAKKSDAERELDLVLKLDKLISVYSKKVQEGGAAAPAQAGAVVPAVPVPRVTTPPAACRVSPTRSPRDMSDIRALDERQNISPRRPAASIAAAAAAMPSALGSITPLTQASQSPTQSPPRSPPVRDAPPFVAAPQAQTATRRLRHCHRHSQPHKEGRQGGTDPLAETLPAAGRRVVSPQRERAQRVLLPAESPRAWQARAASVSPKREEEKAAPQRGQRRTGYEFLAWEAEGAEGDVPPLRPAREGYSHGGKRGEGKPRRAAGRGAVSSGYADVTDRQQGCRQGQEAEYTRAVQRELEAVEHIEMLRTVDDLEREVKSLVTGNRTLQKEKDLLTYENLNYRRRLQHADDALAQLRTLRNTITSLDGLEKKQDDLQAKRQTAVRRLDCNVDHLSQKWGGRAEPAHHRLTRKAPHRPMRK